MKALDGENRTAVKSKILGTLSIVELGLVVFLVIYCVLLRSARERHVIPSPPPVAGVQRTKNGNSLSFRKTVRQLVAALRAGNWRAFSDLTARHLEIGQSMEVYLDDERWSERQLTSLFPSIVFGGKYRIIEPPYKNTAGDLLSTCAVLVDMTRPPSARTKYLFDNFCEIVRDSLDLHMWEESGEDIPAMGEMPFTGPSIQCEDSLHLYWRVGLAKIHGRWLATSLIVSGYN